MSKKIPVGVLGATGSVGQRFVQLLENHPWFELKALSGSERRLGKEFGETCHWILPEPMPEGARELPALPTDPEAFDTIPLVFSALPSDVAREMEPEFAAAGKAVCTNAGAYRTQEDVPVLLPEVNCDHIHLIPEQKKNRGWEGFIVTNPNCTSTGTTIALKALQDAFGLEKVFAVSLQALSGAGYPGVASLDILDNVIPYISNEEKKLEWEPRKMLGTRKEGRIELAPAAFSAHTNRVAVSDGHLVCLSVKCERKVDRSAVLSAFAHYEGPEAARGLPSAPSPIIVVREEPNRPQPRLDRMTGGGMTTVVGRVREDALFDVKFIVLSHNTIRGAAGGSIFNAEVLVREGYIAGGGSLSF